VLVFGAAKDRTLPVGLHRDLARAIETQGGRVTYVEAPDADHLDVPGAPQFQPAAAAFFAALKLKDEAKRP
jgi:hypothetical protein